MPRPETPLRVARGFTIQNRVSSTSRPSACFAIFAVTTILEKSSERATAVTFPISTSLYLMKVLPGSIPSAARKESRIVGPSLRYCWTTIPTPTSAATIGMIHTTGTRVRFFGTLVASGTFARSAFSVICLLLSLAGIPDQAGVERFRREDRQDDHRREEQDPGLGRNGHERL